MPLHTIKIIVPYFGPLPEWFHLFLLSCGLNRDVDFLLVTDQAPQELPSNVKLLRLEFRDFVLMAEQKLGTALGWSGPYKICDAKPALGLLFEEELKDYSHWGYCDTDLLFGRIRRFYDDEVLSYDMVSSQMGLFAGHFAIFRNRPETLRFFEACPNWKTSFADPKYKHFDEFDMATAMLGPHYQSLRYAPQVKSQLRYRGVLLKALFREQYSTWGARLLWKDGTFRASGDWEWREGILTAPFLDCAEVLYAHFMHFRAERWIKNPPWAKLPQVVSPSLARKPSSFRISDAGITPLV